MKLGYNSIAGDTLFFDDLRIFANSFYSVENFGVRWDFSVTISIYLRFFCMQYINSMNITWPRIKGQRFVQTYKVAVGRPCTACLLVPKTYISWFTLVTFP